MKKVFSLLLIIFTIQFYLFAEDKDLLLSNRKWPAHFEIVCSLSGGMKRVKYDKPFLSYEQTLSRKTKPRFIIKSSSSFVRIQYATSLDEEQEQRLREWVDKYKIKNIQQVSPPVKKDISTIRNESQLMVYIDSKEYKVNHYTIENNPQLQKAFDELFEIAKEFTATE